ncbi:MAG: cysteine--tRNA ligase [Planctomycetota bacterium]|jgi:cysteinyl-tRNA synthetase
MKLHNTLSGKVEEFVPVHEGEVRMYNCGPTVYKRPHVGNYMAYLFADLLRRTFEYLGYQVAQVMNITDVGHLTEDDVADAQGEDKLEAEARERKLDPWEIAREIEGEFHEDRELLRIRPAHRYPRATEHIEEMIEAIQGLVEKGHAYVVDGNVYFSVESFPDYGKLSGNRPRDMEAGASGRVDERKDKRSPIDFALWKHDPKHLMQWDSPWGSGFPGWHIECSVMSMKYLGEVFDIHTGGQDNKFPHHECEIAQSESLTGKPFVRYWMHNGWLMLGGEKMAKSKGNLHTLPEVLEMGYAALDFRLYVLKQHYRAPLPFRTELLDEARQMRGRINNFVHYEMADRPEGDEGPEVLAAVETARSAFREALEDDLNTSRAIAAVFEFMTAVNRLEPSRADAARVVAFMREVDSVLAILDDSPAEVLDTEIERLIEERNRARANKDFARSDEIRDELKAKGIELLDTPQGTRWKRV